MSIATEIQRLQTAKSDLKTAIEAKGVTVPSSATIDTYDDYVSQISGGGGGTTYETELKGIIDRSLTSIDIPSGVTIIGDFAFCNSYNLTSVTAPNTAIHIGADAFENCVNITNFDMSNCGIRNISNNAFQGCRSLSSVTFPNSVTSIGNSAFRGCRSLTSIDIPSGITNIGSYTFAECASLTSIDIPNNITSIGGYSFQNCSGLTTVTIGSGVTSISNYAFYGCIGLTSIDIPNSVTSIGANVFKNCSGLLSITCLATTPPSLTSNAFTNTNDCPIYVPASSVDTYKAASGWRDYASRIQAIPNS